MKKLYSKFGKADNVSHKFVMSFNMRATEIRPLQV